METIQRNKSVLFIIAAMLIPASMLFATDIKLAWDANADPNLAGYKVYIGTASKQYGAPINVGKQTTYSVPNPAPGTYYFAVTAYNTSGQESGFSNEVVYSIPTISIVTPTSAGTFTSEAATLFVGGTASDNTGVTLVTWTSSTGASGTASGTNTWTTAGIQLSSGINTITVTARNTSGATGNATLAVTYVPDTIAPTLTITTPTPSGSYVTANATVTIGGAASDNKGVARVTWSNSTGGSGTAAGTTSWSIGNISLTAGLNTIMINATDAAGNATGVTIAVTYDQKPPVISAVTTSSIKNTAASIAWTTDEAADTLVEYGTSTSYGSTASSSSSLTQSHIQALSNLTANTTYHYRVKSKDSVGNTATSADFTFTTTNLPDLSPGLVAAYGFDEGAWTSTADASGAGRTITLKGASWATTAKFGRALSFNGNNNYATASGAGLPAMNGSQTIAFWAYTTAKVTSAQSMVTIYRTSPSASIQFGFKDSLAGVRENGAWIVPGAIQPTTKAWHHYAYTFDGASHKIYIDAKQVGSTTNAPATGNPAVLDVGRGSGSVEYFKGIIDEVVIYSRALSLTEIQALMTLAVSAR
jgi:hypothetical protein